VGSAKYVVELPQIESIRLILIAVRHHGERWAPDLRTVTDVSQQSGQLVSSHPECPRQSRAMPWLRVGLGAFPPSDGRSVNAHDLGQPFLAEAHCLATLRQSVPFPGHDRPPFDVSAAHPFTQVTPCNATGMHQFCALPAVSAFDSSRLSGPTVPGQVLGEHGRFHQANRGRHDRGVCDQRDRRGHGGLDGWNAYLPPVTAVVPAVRHHVGVSGLWPWHHQISGGQWQPKDVWRSVVTTDVRPDHRPSTWPDPPRPGDVLLIDGAASVQFHGERGFAFRVIRVDPRPTYDGWVWLLGYRLDRRMQAIERREIFVRLAGLRNSARPTPATQIWSSADRHADEARKDRADGAGALVRRVAPSPVAA